MGISFAAKGIPIPREAFPDGVDIYPTIPGQTPQGGSKPTYGPPVRHACAVQTPGLDSRPMAEAVEEIRFGREDLVILFAKAPTVPIANGSKIVHVANADGDLATPETFAALGEPIPPRGARRRWTVAVARLA